MAAEDLNTPIIFAKHEKAVKYGTMAISIGLTFWLVLFADFGEKEHCFTKVSTCRSGMPCCLLSERLSASRVLPFRRM